MGNPSGRLAVLRKCLVCTVVCMCACVRAAPNEEVGSQKKKKKIPQSVDSYKTRTRPLTFLPSSVLPSSHNF